MVVVKRCFMVQECSAAKPFVEPSRAADAASYRSTSPITMSMLPMVCMRSSTIVGAKYRYAESPSTSEGC